MSLFPKLLVLSNRPALAAVAATVGGITKSMQEELA